MSESPNRKAKRIAGESGTGPFLIPFLIVWVFCISFVVVAVIKDWPHLGLLNLILLFYFGVPTYIVISALVRGKRH